MTSAELATLALACRTGWPDDLRVLLERFPREQWQTHANLGEMARFWLSRHAMFRELSAMIDAIETRFRTGILMSADLPRQLVPRLQFLLSQLAVHHQIEDRHYFPIFRAADTRLARRRPSRRLTLAAAGDFGRNVRKSFPKTVAPHHQHGHALGQVGLFDRLEAVEMR